MDKEVALITGTSRGIGAAIAKKMASLGYYVIGTSTSGKGDTPEVTEWIKVDFSSISSTEQFLARIDQLTFVSSLVNNSGINIIKPQGEVTDADYTRIENINLKAPFLVAAHVAKKMGETGNGGRIVNIASIWSVVSKKQRTLYSTMKSGLLGLTRSMAVEWADKNILVNSVSPGFVNTELTKHSLNPDESAALAAQVPMNRFAEPVEIAELVSFLAGTSNTYITGQNIVIDGGFTIV